MSFRLSTPLIQDYKPQAEQYLSSLTGHEVRIESIKASWYWLKPVLKMENVVIVNQDPQQNITIQNLFIGISLLQSLFHWQIVPGILYIDGIDLTITKKAHSWLLSGMHDEITENNSDNTALISKILDRNKIILKHVNLKIIDFAQTITYVNNLNFTLTSSYGHYNVRGDALVKNKISTKVSINGDLSLDLLNLRAYSGNLYFGIQNIDFSLFKKLLPDETYHILQGSGNMFVWFDFNQGLTTAVQANMDLYDLVWSYKAEKIPRFFDKIRANLLWHRTKTGWRLKSDHLFLSFAQRPWPENSFVFSYNATRDTYSLFVKELLIDNLLDINLGSVNKWSKKLKYLSDSTAAMDPTVETRDLGFEVNRQHTIDLLKKLHLHGELHDTKINLVNKEITLFLTRFQNLSFKKYKKLPSMQNLSGVLSWKPYSGQLELDSLGAVIIDKRFPTTKFKTINGAISWLKDDNNAWKLNFENIVVHHDNFTFNSNFKLTLDNALQAQNIAMKADFSLNNGEDMLPYLLDSQIDPRVNSWLQNNIKYLDKASGYILINGNLADFPFDKSAGEFNIGANIHGLNLTIARDWPLNTDMEAVIKVKKRNFTTKINSVNLQDIPIKDATLVINDIGHGHEILTLSANINDDAAKILQYISVSPLRKNLATWYYPNIDDKVDLALKVELPLYPQDEEARVNGHLAFNHNKILFMTHHQPLEFSDVLGGFDFDEHAVIAGSLDANFAGGKVSIHAKHFTDIPQRTIINTSAALSINALNASLQSPILNFMHGNVVVNSVLTLFKVPDSNFTDNVHLVSDLEGVTLDLPEGFAKKSSTISPISIDGTLNNSKWSWQINYKDAKLAITSNNDTLTSIKLKTAHNAADINYHMHTHKVSGNIDNYKILSENLLVNKKPTKLNLQDLPNFDLTINKLFLDNLDLGSLHFITQIQDDKTKFNIQDALLSSKDYSLDIKGESKQINNKDFSHITVNLQSRNLSKALKSLQIDSPINAKKLDITMDAIFSDSINNFSVGALTGDVKIILKNGNIQLDQSSENKLALGKLLGILSLQTIPRRLQLDFSDLHGGYTFDICEGAFTLKHGVLSTHESYLDGPTANVQMRGDLDIIKHMYNLELKITPYIAASLPLVATLAGGPAIGAITWVASKILNKGLEKISQYSYKISGPWDNPQVKHF
jgi:uncharacterized protein YhdP